MPRPKDLIDRFHALIASPGFGLYTKGPPERAEAPLDARPPGPAYTRFPSRAEPPESVPEGAEAFISSRTVKPRRVVPVRRANGPLQVKGPSEVPETAGEPNPLSILEDLPGGMLSIDVSDVEACIRQHARLPSGLAVSSDFKRGYELAVKNFAVSIYHRLVDKRESRE